MALLAFPRSRHPLFAVALVLALLTAAGGSPAALAQGGARPAASASPSPASPFEQPGPPYPEAAETARQTGTVTLRVTYPREGAPLKVEIVGSSGSSVLDNAAADFARRHWRSHGLAAVATFDVPVQFRGQPAPPVSFRDFPATATVGERKEELFWRAVPVLTSLLIDQNGDEAAARAREAMRVYAGLDAQDFSAPVALLQALISNFEPAADTRQIEIVIGGNTSGTPRVLTVDVPPTAVPKIVLLVQKTIAAAAAELRAALPPPDPAKQAALDAALARLEASAAALVARSPVAPATR